MEKSAPRRDALREKLVAAAETIIRDNGLAALKARDVAKRAGCALGAIYTAFDDIDELVLSVNRRTLEQLEAALKSATDARSDPEAALLTLARAYLAFARANETRWRALFEHRLPPGREPPDWFVSARDRLFTLLEAPVAALSKENLTPERRALVARTLFSAVHGVVSLGMEEKIAPTSAAVLDEEVALLVGLLARGAGARD